MASVQLCRVVVGLEVGGNVGALSFQVGRAGRVIGRELALETSILVSNWDVVAWTCLLGGDSVLEEGKLEQKIRSKFDQAL